MSIAPYVKDVLSQPVALRDALAHYPVDALLPVREALQAGQFERVLITGMGASLTGLYPAALILAKLPVPVQLIETAELYYYMPQQVSEKTLLWVVSQSGRSAEIVNLLEQVRAGRKPYILGTTNDLESPLAQMSDLVIPLSSGPEYTVSSRSYANTLAVTQLMAVQLTGGDVREAMNSLSNDISALEDYLAGWQEQVKQIKSLLGLPENMYFLGRGPSMAAVTTGSLVMKEAAKHSVEGMSTAQFRHGPLELADETLTVLVFAGEESTRALNLSLANDVVRYGGRAFWLDTEPETNLPGFTFPTTSELGRPLAEVLPLQMLSVALAEQKNLIPGHFRHLGKVVLKE